jgi:hypothetical protein
MYAFYIDAVASETFTIDITQGGSQGANVSVWKINGAAAGAPAAYTAWRYDIGGEDTHPINGVNFAALTGNPANLSPITNVIVMCSLGLLGGSGDWPIHGATKLGHNTGGGNGLFGLLQTSAGEVYTDGQNTGGPGYADFVIFNTKWNPA